MGFPQISHPTIYSYNQDLSFKKNNFEPLIHIKKRQLTADP
jgi:hypothetical protein